MSYKTIYQDVEVEVSLDEWSDEELVSELRDRGHDIGVDVYDAETMGLKVKDLDNKLLRALYRSEDQNDPRDYADLRMLVRQSLRMKGYCV